MSEVDNPTREVVARSVIAAAEAGDRLAFVTAADRYGSFEQAQELVRHKAVLRMADRVVAGAHQPLPATTIRSAVEHRSDTASDTLYGHFTVWDAWYEVDSFFEGHFMERTVRGSTKKTMAENRASMRALFQHGTDPIVADKPLGPIRDLLEDDIGAYYEVPLLRDDNGELVDYVRSIAPGLRDGLYGASFRFRPMREFWDDAPEASDYNADGLPERSLTEMRVTEFGPVTFPASPAATAAVRSRNELAPEVQDNETPIDEDDLAGRSQENRPHPPNPDAATDTGGTSDAERREHANRFRNEREWQEWLTSRT